MDDEALLVCVRAQLRDGVVIHGHWRLVMVSVSSGLVMLSRLLVD